MPVRQTWESPVCPCERRGRVLCAHERDMGGSGVPMREKWESPVCP